MNRIVGAMRIGDMTLDPIHLYLHVDAAAPADLDHVAQPYRAGWLANQTEIRHLVMRLHPFQHLHGAIGRHAFLVPRDQETDRSVWLALLQMLRNTRDKGGDRPLHVAGPAPVQRPVPHVPAKRVISPLRRTHRHDIRMAREAEMRAAGANAGEDVLDLAKAQPMDGKAEPPKPVSQHILRAGVQPGSPRHSGSVTAPAATDPRNALNPATTH